MGTIFDTEYQPPERGPADTAFRVVEAIAALVPGGAALLNQIVTPPIERRRNEWMEEVGSAIWRLQSEGAVDVNALITNDKFVDAFLAASQAAIRTSELGKRSALRNAVLNAAVSGSPDVTEQQLFLSMTDRFAELHILVLKLFQNAANWRQSNGASLPFRSNATAVLRDAFPDSAARDALYKQLWTDLFAAGLVRLPMLENGLEGDARTIRRTTELGDAYLDFIESPLPE
jgi:hypothetical protein